jgi:hypothetical protein
MQWLVDRYGAPSAELRPAELESRLNEAAAFLGTVQLMQNFEFLTDAVTQAEVGSTALVEGVKTDLMVHELTVHFGTSLAE